MTAIPVVPPQEAYELQRWPLKAIIYSLELGQILTIQHLEGGLESEELRDRPLYVTRTSNITWSNPGGLFGNASAVEIRIHPRLTVPSPNGESGDTHSWLVEVHLSALRNTNNYLKAEMVMVRPPDLL